MTAGVAFHRSRPEAAAPDAAAPARWTLTSEQRVAAGIDETFAFFADPANLQRLTPPQLDFRILTPLPIEMKPGALIAYRLRLMGVPFGWLTRIDDWRPGVGFTDTQMRGPYARWVHRHAFEPAPEGGTIVRDRVDYALPLAPLSDPAHAMFVRPQLARIFGYRRQVIAGILGSR